jgi:hypothetical protein
MSLGFWPPTGRSYSTSFTGTRRICVCGILLLAVERYRRANQCWPQRLDDLVPAYLSKVPLFPFDGQPLRLERSDSGVVLFAASQDCQYNLFFSLWDVSKRRQPPRLHKPAR